MGSEDFYPEERPVHRVEVDGFWMDEHPVTAAEFRRFVRDTGYVTLAERPPNAEDYPDADPELLVPGSLVFHRTAGPVNLQDYRNWWAWTPGAYWKQPGRARDDDQRTRPASRHPGGLRGRRSVCRVGGQGASDRGRVGARGARRARGRHVRLGRRALPRRAGDGEHLAGRVPVAEPEGGRVRRHVAGRQLPAQRLRPPRHDRERLGVDGRLLHAQPPGRGGVALLRPPQPARDHVRAEPCARRSRASSSRVV